MYREQYVNDEIITVAPIFLYLIDCYPAIHPSGFSEPLALVSRLEDVPESDVHMQEEDEEEKIQ